MCACTGMLALQFEAALVSKRLLLSAGLREPMDWMQTCQFCHTSLGKGMNGTRMPCFKIWAATWAMSNAFRWYSELSNMDFFMAEFRVLHLSS